MDVEIDISNTTIETERLILRPWLESDIDDLYEYASVDGVGEKAGWRHHESIEETRNILHMFMEDRNVFAIVYKENNKVIGSFGLHRSWANQEPQYKDLKVKEIGYVLSKDYWGMGLMPEAVREVAMFCFEKLGLDALTVAHFVDNSQSRRVIEKCGFKFVKKSEFHSEQLGKSFQDMKYILIG